jgi:ACS family tartrate transporter-like MFS transporter
MPLMIKSMGFSTMDTGMLVIIPAVAGGLTLPLWGYLTDRTAAKERVLVAACSIMTLGLVLAAFLLPSPWAILGFSLTLIGMYGVAPSSAMIPYTIIRSSSVPAAIGIVSAGVNIGAFAGAYAVGRLADVTGNYTMSMMVLSGSALISLVFALILEFLRRASSPRPGELKSS